MKVFCILCQCEDEWEEEVPSNYHNLNLHTHIHTYMYIAYINKDLKVHIFHDALNVTFSELLDWVLDIGIICPAREK